MSEKTTFSCGEALDIVNARSLHNRLQKSLNKSYTIELKADKIEKADTAGLQLIVALLNEVKNHNCSIVWKKPSDTLLSTARLLGLYQQLELPE